jgi:hypothetical protein
MSDDDVTVNGTRWTSTWLIFRGVITFLLGIGVIVDALLENNSSTVGKLIVGLLLIGIPSLEDIARLTRRRG